MPEESLNPTGLDDYWAKEYLMAHVFRKYCNLNYLEYLPGRVYTYRILMKKIINTIGLRSIIDVGCGSGMLLHEAARLGITASGIDISRTALRFAQYLAAEFNSRNLTLAHADALGDWVPPLSRADLVSNVGSLEHLPFEDQVKFVRYMGFLSRKYVLLCVPNVNSPLFLGMESAELDASNKMWVYPEEYAHFGVNFSDLAGELGWSIVCESTVHIASTSVVRLDLELGAASNRTLQNVPIVKGSSQEILEYWLGLELSCPQQLLDRLGWFRFVIFSL